MTMTRKRADEIIGSVSDGNWKLHCRTYGLPVSSCHKRCADAEKSTCHPKNCYAQRNCYRFGNVQEAQQKRLNAIKAANSTDIIDAFGYHFQKSKYFRLWDSGDFPTRRHFWRIIDAAQENPGCKIYAPTKRYEWVTEYMDDRWNLPNLCLRAGMYIIDPPKKMMEGFLKEFRVISYVFKDNEPFPEHPICRANHGMTCGVDCFICWEKSVRVVGYPWH
jgi:hypothetical protein